MASKRRPRASALVRAEHGAAPTALSTPQRAVFHEALRLGEDLVDAATTLTAAFGRWLLEKVFDDDATAALDRKTKNPVWRELVRRAGGPTLRLSRHGLYVALVIAAHDQHITDQTWRTLDAGRKELLLPLARSERLREAAQHVTKFKLTQASTQEYVTQLLDEDGRKRQIRWTASQLLTRVKTLRAGFEKSATLRRAAEVRERLDPAERVRLAEEIDGLRQALGALAKTFRGKR